MTRAEIASIKINQAGKFTDTDVAAVAAWLRHHAEMLEMHHKEYNYEFTGAYESFMNDDDGLDGTLADP